MMIAEYNESTIMNRVKYMNNRLGDIPLAFELKKFGLTRDQVLNHLNFQSAWIPAVIDGKKMYTRKKPVPREWQKKLPGFKSIKKNPDVLTIFEKAKTGQALTEDEAIFFFTFYRRRYRAAQKRARKKRKGAYGTAIVAGAIVAAYYGIPAILPGDAAKAASEVGPGTAAVAAKGATDVAASSSSSAVANMAAKQAAAAVAPKPAAKQGDGIFTTLLDASAKAATKEKKKEAEPVKPAEPGFFERLFAPITAKAVEKVIDRAPEAMARVKGKGGEMLPAKVTGVQPAPARGKLPAIVKVGVPVVGGAALLLLIAKFIKA